MHVKQIKVMRGRITMETARVFYACDDDLTGLVGKMASTHPLPPKITLDSAAYGNWFQWIRNPIEQEDDRG